ncbi:hypothetical protein AAFG07_32770 [Bradyrhizobium sp. B097]|uniref:hypothetical protein n=1 Tax=Bradyrhizobium sp. B097 TaxID=3140244 RepID=UPI0031832D3F
MNAIDRKLDGSEGESMLKRGDRGDEGRRRSGGYSARQELCQISENDGDKVFQSVSEKYFLSQFPVFR